MAAAPMSPHVISTLAIVAHWTVIAAVSLRVVMRRVPVGVSLAWLVVVFSVPFAGAALYLALGEKRLGRRRAARIAGVLGDARARSETFRRRHGAAGPETAEPGAGLRRQAANVLGSVASAGNRLRLLEDFPSVFDSMVADIDGAQRTCDLEFYIWHDAGRAGDVAEALLRAVRRGVACRVAVDAMGSKAFLRGPQARALRQAGVHVLASLPAGPLRAIFVRADLRNHRKIMVIDGRLAYAGSQNLVDPRYFKQDAGVGEWVDAMVRIEGPAAEALGDTFDIDWSVETGGALGLHRDGLARAEAPPPVEQGGALVQVVPSGPGFRPEAIHQLLLTAIYSARRELVMTTPYFVPDEAILTAVLSAALRGVAVTLLIPARNDSLLVRYAGVAHFDELLAAGVRVALFEGGLLHTKSITVDGERCIFGSVNLDMRSVWLNFEISLFVYDTAFAGAVRDLQQQYLARAQPLDAAAWRRRPFVQRLAENTARLLGPLL
jgi:cardiolipin synthase